MSGKQFEKSVAIVTGAGVGIGYEIAHQLAMQGACVLLNDVDREAAEQAVHSIEQEGGVCRAASGDVSDVAFVRSMVADAVKTFGKLDITVCNAGLTSWGDFFEYDQDRFDRLMSVNMRGTYFLTQAAARQMRQQGQGGRILLTSSVTGHQAVRYLSCYSMTKAAVEMLARNLVIELSPYNITINCIAPGSTVTPRNLADDPNYAEIWSRVTPLARAAQPIDMANAALFLLSPGASYITGHTLVVDGGWTAISPTPTLDFVEKPSDQPDGKAAR